MADPVSMMLIGSAVASGASSVIGGLGAQSSADAQARAMLLEAKLSKAITERQAKELTDQGYFAAQERRKEVDDALSTLQARAAASGGGSTNPTVLGLIRQIASRGEEGAQSEIRAGRQKAYQVRAQSILDSSVAGMRARALRQEGKTAALGSYIGAAGNALSAFARVPAFGAGASTSIGVSGSVGTRLPSAGVTGYARFR